MPKGLGRQMALGRSLSEHVVRDPDVLGESTSEHTEHSATSRGFGLRKSPCCRAQRLNCVQKWIDTLNTCLLFVVGVVFGDRRAPWIFVPRRLSILSGIFATLLPFDHAFRS